MKKVISIVLCLMMLISLMPSAAFADDETAGGSAGIQTNATEGNNPSDGDKDNAADGDEDNAADGDEDNAAGGDEDNAAGGDEDNAADGDEDNADENEKEPLASGTCGEGLTWELSEDGVLTISGSGVMTDYESEDSPWCSYRESIKSAVLCDGVTSIGYGAFERCSNLISITIPDSVTSIGGAAFERCSSLTSIIIPDSVTSIGDCAFKGCSGLKYVFYTGSSSDWEKISLGSSNTPLTDAAMHYEATDHTPAVSPAVDATCTKTGLTEGEHCSVCNAVLTAQEEIPAKGHTEVIDEAKAATCTETGLTEGKHCSVCNEVLVEQETVPTLAHTYVGNVCSVCGALSPDYDGSAEKYGVCGDSMTWILSTDGTLTISGTGTMENYENEASPWFSYRESIKSVILSDGVASIGYSAFERSTNLTSVTISDSVTSISDCAFMGCSGLKYVFYTGNSSDWEQISLGNSNTPLTDAKMHYEATDHTSVVSPAVDATCTETGLTEGTHCSVCDVVLTAQEEIPAKGHTVVIDEAKAATCTETGLTEGSHCSVCDVVLIEQEEIPATGHTVVTDEAKAATCTETGLTEGKHCSVCNEVLTAQEEIPATGHTVVVDEGKAATCTEAGITEGSHCSVCNEVLVEQKVIPATGHTFISNVCTVCGTLATKAYGVCGDSMTWSLDIDGVLTISGSGAMADYETDGSPWYSYRESIKSAVLPDGVTSIGDAAFYGCKNLVSITIPESVTSIGDYAFRGCSGLKYVFYTGNSSDWEKIDLGSFNAYLKSAAIHYEATDHTSAVTPAVDATCTETGLTEGTHCSVCDAVLTAQEVIPAKGHTEVTDEPVAATCGKDGLTEGSRCSVCNTIFTAQEVIPATGNHTVVTDEAVPATCTETGLTEGSHCSVCNTVLTAQEEIPATGHTEVVDEAVPATRTETGLTEGSHCSVCGEVLIEQEIIPVLNYTVTLPDVSEGTQVLVDGVAYTAGENGSIDLPDGSSVFAETFSYGGTSGDLHTVYPTGMTVYKLEYTDDGYTATHIEELDNIMQYSGTSIRVTGNKGIRMITSVPESTRQLLIDSGVSGYSLVEYGTIVQWDSALGGELTMSTALSGAYAYKKGAADPIFNRTGGMIQFTNVLVNFTMEQCVPDLAMRPYMILQAEDGSQVTLYGGTVHRSIAYIAYQNADAFSEGSAAYKYIHEIIDTAYKAES